jgi:hypothetical protein
MHDNITIIKQEPARVYRTFMVMWQDTCHLQAVLNFIIDGAELPFAITSADNKVISKTAHSADIQQHNITGLPVTGSFNDSAGYFYRFQALNLR